MTTEAQVRRRQREVRRCYSAAGFIEGGEVQAQGCGQPWEAADGKEKTDSPLRPLEGTQLGDGLIFLYSEIQLGLVTPRTVR